MIELPIAGSSNKLRDSLEEKNAEPKEIVILYKKE